MLFAGHFEPCCRSGRFGTRGDQAGTSIIYNGDNHQVVTTASARVFTPEGENAEPGVRPDATDLLDAPLLDTLRFYLGTSATDAFAIIKEGARAFGDDKDFGAGFYMASGFKVAADFAVYSSFSTTTGNGDHCVLVLDLDTDAYVFVFPSL